MLIGISTYTYTWAFGVPGSLPARPMTWNQLVDKAVEFKVDCIQVADNYPLPDKSPEELTLLRDYAKKNRIGIEIGGRGLTDENLDRYIRLADYFSSPLLRMVIDRMEYQPDSETVVAVIRNALGSLESKGITLALENHDRLHAAEFRKIIEKVNSDFTGICLDCVNSMGIGEGLTTVMENLAPYTVNLHVKDFSVKRVSHMMGFVIEGTPAGKGFLNLPVMMEILGSHGRCRSAILELWTPPAENLAETISREEAWAGESIEYMKELIYQP